MTDAFVPDFTMIATQFARGFFKFLNSCPEKRRLGCVALQRDTIFKIDKFPAVAGGCCILKVFDTFNASEWTVDTVDAVPTEDWAILALVSGRVLLGTTPAQFGVTMLLEPAEEGGGYRIDKAMLRFIK